MGFPIPNVYVCTSHFCNTLYIYIVYFVSHVLQYSDNIFYFIYELDYVCKYIVSVLERGIESNIVIFKIGDRETY